MMDEFEDQFLLLGMHAAATFLAVQCEEWRRWRSEEEQKRRDEEDRRRREQEEERRREEEERRRREEEERIAEEEGRPRTMWRRKRFWVRQLYCEREEYGHERMMRMLETEDLPFYKNFQRVTPVEFRSVLARVGPRIAKKDTSFRKCLSPALKLAVTMRYLASGELYTSLAFGFRVSMSSISTFIPEVCDAIIEEYMPELIRCPQSPEEWKIIADGFYTKWNMPHCIGAIDGKHIAIQCPPHGGSKYYNYKGFHSIVLMAIVDADYNFIYVDVGCCGSGSDGGVFDVCSFKKGMDTNSLGIPEEEALPNSQTIMPYFLVGDEAFPLKSWLMKPIPRRGLNKEERVFNYRLSRARRVVENAFGILAAKYRCLHTIMLQRPERVQKIVMACCCLHNFIRKSLPQHAGQAADLAGCSSNSSLTGMNLPNNRNQGTSTSKDQRNALVKYFSSPEGSVPWQDDRI